VLEISMKNLIFVVIAGAVAVVAYFVVGQSEKGAVTEAPVVETSPVAEALEDVKQATEEAIEEAASGVEAATEAAQEAATEAAEAVTEQVEAVQNAAEAAADSAEAAVTEAVEGAADAANDATAAATNAAEEAAAAATDVASDATDAATEATEAATDVAAQAGDAAVTGVADLASVFTADGFDMAKVSEVIDGSSLGALQKASLKTAIESAVNNPEMLTQALDTAKQALGL
jgi:membrane-associated HD superfamily phosphohydrolase